METLCQNRGVAIRRKRLPVLLGLLMITAILLPLAVVLTTSYSKGRCSAIGCGEWRWSHHSAGGRRDTSNGIHHDAIARLTQQETLSPLTPSHRQPNTSVTMETTSSNPPPPPLPPKFQNLTSEEVKSVNTFLFFIGYGRSGHSLVASILDAHPSVIIAHEYYLFDKLNQPRRYPMLKNKSGLFDELYWSSYTSAVSGWRAAVNTSKGYNFEMPGTWQGRFEQLKVIGDKTGGATAMMYHKDPSKFKNTYRALKQTVGVPIKTLHVVRNPFDMIATVALYQASGHPASIKVPATPENKFTNIAHLSKAVNIILNKADAVSKMPSDAGLSVMEVHLEDLIKDPHVVLKKLCDYLELHCSEEYLRACVSRVNTTLSRSREVVVWPKMLVDRVVMATKTYSFFNRYSFDSN